MTLQDIIDAYEFILSKSRPKLLLPFLQNHKTQLDVRKY